MNRRITLYCFATAAFAVIVSAVLFLRASSAYSELRKVDSAATLEDVSVAADRSNLWSVVLMIAVGIATIFLGRLYTLRHKDDQSPAA